MYITLFSPFIVYCKNWRSLNKKRKMSNPTFVLEYIRIHLQCDVLHIIMKSVHHNHISTVTILFVWTSQIYCNGNRTLYEMSNIESIAQKQYFVYLHNMHQTWSHQKLSSLLSRWHRIGFGRQNIMVIALGLMIVR